MKISRTLISAGLVLLLVTQGCAPQPAKTPATITATEPATQITLPALPSPTKTYQDLVVGFSQIGAESEWRTADTVSIKQEAARLGVDLIFMDAQQEQENQILAIRTFIAEKVDVIGISAVVETGWGDVFQEAKAAGIPIIFVDRPADVAKDEYVTYLGSDFLEEGRKAARVMVSLTGGQANIVELAGTIDSAPAVDRSQGFREILQGYPNMKIIDSESGDFTRARGLEVMRTFLQKHGKSITAVFSQNDDMGLGAIQAIQEYGLKPGVDIQIVSVDAEKEAFEAMIAGTLNATVECNPLLGPQFFELALKVANGEAVPKRVPSIESIFFPYNAATILPTRKY
jgi:simple sugar transport system substrate-binding protein